MRDEIVTLSISRRRKFDFSTGEVIGHEYAVNVGEGGGGTQLPAYFDTLPRARSVVRFLEQIYKEQGRKVRRNLRPTRG